MSIRYIPNDPRSAFAATATITPHAERPAQRAGFSYSNQAPEGVYAINTDEFLYWQCRESALRAVAMWEAVDRQPLTKWQSGQQIKLLQREPGDQLNAYYDRASVRFYRLEHAGESYCSGASTDVVAHEVGHAILDRIRPQLWDAIDGERAAFHEAFADCMSLLVAIEDQTTREQLVVGGLIDSPNFVEATAEDLAHGVAQFYGADVNDSVPRRALNAHQWAMPATLPVDGGPGVLVNNAHSISMIFTGCFYDLLRRMFRRTRGQNQRDLLDAARTCGRLLGEASRSAPLHLRFFRSVGNAMLIADEQLHNGVNRDLLITAFADHNITLDSTDILNPSVELAGRPPRRGSSTIDGIITRASRRDFVASLGSSEDQRLMADSLSFVDGEMPTVLRRQKIPLGDVAEELEGVSAIVEDQVLIGEDRGRAAILGHPQQAADLRQEVQYFVASLAKNGDIAGLSSAHEMATHEIVSKAREKQLVRRRFACKACGGHHS